MRFESYPDSARLTGSAEKHAWFEPRQAIRPASHEHWRDPKHAHVIKELLGDDQARRLLAQYDYGETS